MNPHKCSNSLKELLYCVILKPTIKEDLYLNGDDKMCHSDGCQNPS